MKILNLKNGLHRFFVLILVVTLIGACNKDETDTPLPELSQEELAAKLEADPDFFTLRTLNKELLDEVTNRMIAHGLSGEDIKSLYVNRDADQLQKVFGGPVLEDKLAEVQAVNTRLMANYSELLPETVADLETQALIGFDNLGTSTTFPTGKGCSWRYWVCAGGAWSGYAACLIGTTGWGAFFCSVAYYAAIALCRDSYC